MIGSLGSWVGAWAVAYRHLQQLTPTPPHTGDVPGRETPPDEAYDFLERCLDLSPVTRITAPQALEHPFLLQTDELTAPPPASTDDLCSP